MKYYLLATVGLTLMTSLVMGDDKVNPKEQKDVVSYGIGLNIGKEFKSQELEINPDAVAAGIRDALADKKPQISEDDIKKAMMTVQKEMMAKQAAKASALGEKNKKAGEDYLAANKKKDGVVTLPSGLQYKIITAGKGPKPTAADTVKTHYRGTLIDGTEFDSSYKRGEPATFGVTQVIKGWTEALQLMPVGSKWQLYIPSELAYGERGPEVIGPNSVLVFDIELLSIEK